MRLTFEADGQVRREGGLGGSVGRVRRALGRFSDRLLEVRTRLKAVAARGGAGARECRMVVKLRNGGEVVVKNRAPSAAEALASALKSARDAVVRTVDRRVARRRGRP